MLLCCAVLLAPAAAADEAVPVRLPPVTVIGVTPLPGMRLPIDEIPGNVQQFSARDVARPPGQTAAEFLERNAAGVTAASNTGNPFQADVIYRGFTASPLLGTPQGLSVFLDGVRINEVFGDVINWDLLPQNAIATAALVPGSNPVFGLNTLGGALTLATKDGAAFPGSRAALTVGSFGRIGGLLEHGGAHGAWDWYATADTLDENGWRAHSESRLRRAFGKLRHAGADSSAEVTVQLADTKLAGTQALPAAMLGSPELAYTWPDLTDNRLAAITGRGELRLAPHVTLTGLLYARRLRTATQNSNVVPTDDADEPPASNVRANAVNRTYGASVQVSCTFATGSLVHRLAIGAALDGGDTAFTQSSATANITSDREIVDAAAPVTTAAADARSHQAGLYALDSIALGERATALLSARYQEARITVRDPTGTNPGLEGEHRYGRVNPAAGATYRLAPGTSAYVNWSRGMRVPTAMELTCADAAAPCSLPSIFVADPALNAVLATTTEAGVRHRSAAGSLAVALYRTHLADDIQFIATGAASGNVGYFSNVGATERAGLELSGGTRRGPVGIELRYGYTRARFLTGFRTHSPANAAATEDGSIVVEPGDRMPGIPAHAGRVRLSWQAAGTLELGASLAATSFQYARGNENNADPAGRIPGRSLVDLDLRWQPAAGWSIEAGVSNLFDRRYAVAGTLGTNLFRGPGFTYAPALAGPEPFLLPGAPRAGWVVLQYAFGAA